MVPPSRFLHLRGRLHARALSQQHLQRTIPFKTDANLILSVLRADVHGGGHYARLDRIGPAH